MDMKYFDVVPEGFLIRACPVVRLYYDSFLEFVRENNIDEIFRVDSEDQNLVEKGVNSSVRSGYFFCAIHPNGIFLTDPMGFTDLESLEESIESGAFTIINQLKGESDDNFWSYEVGRIYISLKERGYKSGKDIREAYEFLEGNMVLDYDQYLKCSKKAKEGQFRYYRELCIAKEAGFNDSWDFDDAERYKTPNIRTLEALRTLKEIKKKFGHEDLSQSLVVGVIISLTALEKVKTKTPTFIDLDRISYLFEYWSPDVPYEGFGVIKTEEDIIHFLESSKGRSVGHYDLSNHQFQFSKARIYIDGANVAFKGLYKGENRQSLKAPDMEVLKDCYRRLSKEGIGKVKIYMDGLVVKKINQKGPPKNRDILKELRNLGIMETSIKGEKADEPLLQKLRDDPFAYVVANDSYVDDYHLTERDIEHLIQVKFSENELEFHGPGYQNLKNWNEMFSGWEDKASSLFHVKKLGFWPYSRDFYKYSIMNRGCC